MTAPKNPLDTIEAQLDVLDRALTGGHFEMVDLPQWSPPAEHPELDADRLVVLLDRIESTIRRVDEAKHHVAEAQTALSRRRHIARVYASSGT